MRRLLHVGWGFRPFRFGGLVQYAEDLMAAQIAQGDEVGWFCAARHYPKVSGPRLRQFTKGGVRMYEVVNAAVLLGGHKGTPDPLNELDDAPTECLFEKALDEHRPDVVHVHELLGLPSSLLEIPKRRGIPVVMTLQDYFTLCPTIKLWDANDQLCERLKPGEMCTTCCRDAPTDHSEFVQATLLYHQDQVLRNVPGLAKIPRPQKVVELFRKAEAPLHQTEPAPRTDVAPPADYDTRREVNVRRLSSVDRLVAMSTRVHEIYVDRGVDPGVIETMQLTLAHVEHIAPQKRELQSGPLKLVTLAGFGNAMKGGDVLLDALRRLEQQFGPEQLQLTVHGYIDEPYKQAIADSRLATDEGFYEPSEMSAVLAPHHAGIVPSVWEEAYGYVGIEMLAAGLPVIGNTVGGITDYVKDGETGWRNERADGEGLATIIAGIVQNPAQIADLSTTIVERRDTIIKPMRVHVDEIDALYASLA